MNVDTLSDYLSKYVVEILKKRGIENLYPPQEEAVRKGLFSDKNLVVAIPTASGKTLIAELAMVYEVIRGGKCLYTVPLRALAGEKFEEFTKWEEIGVKIGISTGDYESKDEWLGECDIVVTTSEKADSLLRNEASWLKKLSLLVVDEIHLIDSAKRGATLEILIAKLKKLNPNLRIIALSATIPNADEIAEWLNAELIKSEWRPTPLYEYVFYPGRLLKFENGFLRENKAESSIERLIVKTLEEGGQVLVFESTRRNAESYAVKISGYTKEFVEDNSDVAEKVLEENEGEMSRKLSECVKLGSAFHHAGLLNSQRVAIEKAFREGRIKVLVATPTLAAGVNLPARRVILKSYRRYDSGVYSPIMVSEYKQMAGRAGRPGLDEYGEAIIVTKTREEALKVAGRYLAGEPEKVISKLGSETHLRFHTLSLISEGIANSFEDLLEFYSTTFFAYQNEFTLEWEIRRIVLQLEKWEMIVEYAPTSFGKLVSKLYIDPLSGFIFKEELSKFDNLSDLAMLHLICRTPDMELLSIRKADSWIENELENLREELTYYPSVYSADYDFFLKEFKTALCLYDWINERDEDLICEKYGIAPGDLRRIVETAEWLMHSLRRIAEHLSHTLASKALKLEMRLKYGVKEELLELVKLKNVGRKRARKLYNAGIKNLEDLVQKRKIAERLIGSRIVEKILS